MAELPLLRSEYLSELKNNISQNKEYYFEDNIWLDSYFKSLSPIDQKQLNKPVNLKVQSSNNEQLDFENTKLLYDSLKNIRLSLAADERFWSYLTHVTYWDYMRKRWPIESLSKKFSQKNYIKTHYFFGEKPRNRNGIARLWWIGQVTYDSNLENPFELTEFMLKNQDQDLTRMIMETPTIARNRVAVNVILKCIKRLQSEDENFNTRKFIRYATKYFNFTGSVTLWDSLNTQDVEQSVQLMSERWMQQFSKTVNQ